MRGYNFSLFIRIIPDFNSSNIKINYKNKGKKNGALNINIINSMNFQGDIYEN